MTLSTAVGYINDYVNGTRTSTDTNIVSAITYLATNGHYATTSIAAYNLTIKGYSSDRYDTYILAFCNYWYNRFSSLGFKYNPMYVKAMMGVETTMGTDTGLNGTTDVMQCLTAANPAIYCIARISPPSGSGVPYDQNEALNYGITSSGYTFAKNIFTSLTSHIVDTGKFSYFNSICAATLWLGYKTAHAGGDLQQGITDYNGGGNTNYWDDVYSCYQNPTAYLT